MEGSLSFPCRRLASFVSAVLNGGGKTSGRMRLPAALIALCTVAAFPLHSIDIVARTESGRSVILATVEKDTAALEITCRGKGLTLEDPVIDIRGLAELDALQELKFFHVPQIASYRFLHACTSLKRLVISFGRVRSIDFLTSMPDLVAFHLEFSNDWESELGLPFAAESIDLSANRRLEYLAFRICDLKRLPVFEDVPGSLRYVDLSYNPIEIREEDSAALDSLATVERVFLIGASVAGELPGRNANLIFDEASLLYPKYFSE